MAHQRLISGMVKVDASSPCRPTKEPPVTRTRTKFVIFATLVLGAAALSACSSGASQAGASPSSTQRTTTTPTEPAPIDTGSHAPGATASTNSQDPCSLITDAEAGTLFGGAATHKTGGSKDASNGSGVVVTENRCEWDLVKSDQLGHDLWVAVYAGADRAYFDDLVTHATPIPGLGEAAAGDPFASGGFSEIEVISKGTVIGIYGSLPTRDGIQHAAALAVAKL
jgi:hypothetical protein